MFSCFDEKAFASGLGIKECLFMIHVFVNFPISNFPSKVLKKFCKTLLITQEFSAAGLQMASDQEVPELEYSKGENIKHFSCRVVRNPIASKPASFDAELDSESYGMRRSVLSRMVGELRPIIRTFFKIL